MFVSFSQSLFKELVKNGFEPVKALSDGQELTEAARYTCLIKPDGSCWYAIMIVNTKMLPYNNFMEFNKSCIKYFNKLQDKVNVRTIFVLNLFVFENGRGKYRELLDKDTDFFPESLNNIYWGADLSLGELITARNQPTKILNLNDIIEGEIKRETSVISIRPNRNGDMDYIYETALREHPYLEIKSKRPIVTYILIIINVVVTIIMELNGGSNNIDNLIKYGAVVPYLIFYGQHYRLWTALFIHIGITHLAYNCFSLYIFGSKVEKYYGRFWFLIIYIISGIVGNVFSLFLTNAVSAGASGAIFGLVGAIAILSKKSNRPVDGLNYKTMVVYIVISMSSGALKSQIDNFAHLGGLITGIITGFIISSFFIKRPEKGV